MTLCSKCNEWTDSEMYWKSNPLEKFCRRCSGLKFVDNNIGSPCNSDDLQNNVSSPAHYASGNIEVIDAIEDWGLDKDYYLGNAVKYIARAGKKNPDTLIEDLKKAVWYLNRRIGGKNGS